MFLTRFITIFLCLLVLVGGVALDRPLAAQSLEPGRSAQRNIVIVGDSLSAAYNMESREAWPSLLQLRLDQDGYPWRVFNSSITGDTTQGGLARLPRLLQRYSPDLVVIELGGNDGLRGLPIDVTEANLSKMVTLSQEQGADVILAGIRIPPNYGAEYVERFEGIFPAIAETYGTGLVPFFMDGVAVTPGMMQDDGIHPSVQAQPVLLDNLWPVLEPMLSAASVETTVETAE